MLEDSGNAIVSLSVLLFVEVISLKIWSKVASETSGANWFDKDSSFSATLDLIICSENDSPDESNKSGDICKSISDFALDFSESYNSCKIMQIYRFEIIIIPSVFGTTLDANASFGCVLLWFVYNRYLVWSINLFAFMQSVTHSGLMILQDVIDLTCKINELWFLFELWCIDLL